MTLAEGRFAYARDKIAGLALQDDVTIQLRDYSGVDGECEKMVEMRARTVRPAADPGRSL